MADRSAARHRGCGALITLCAAMIPAAADAQNATIDRIEAIERQIRNWCAHGRRSASARADTDYHLATADGDSGAVGRFCHIGEDR